MDRSPPLLPALRHGPHLGGTARGDPVFKRRNLGDERFGAQAFDLGNDPLETRDLFDPDNPRHQDARKGLLDYKALLQLGYTEDAESGDLDVNPDDQTHLLQALGYAP